MNEEYIDFVRESIQARHLEVPFETTRQLLAKMILFIRKFSGLRQKDLADKIGIPQANLSRMENGQTKISFEFLIIFCQDLTVPYLEIINLYDELRGIYDLTTYL